MAIKTTINFILYLVIAWAILFQGAVVEVVALLAIIYFIVDQVAGWEF